MVTKTNAKAMRYEGSGAVYCPICTHTVEAVVETHARSARVKPGQKCSRCSSSLDAGYVLNLRQAA